MLTKHRSAWRIYLDVSRQILSCSPTTFIPHWPSPLNCAKMVISRLRHLLETFLPVLFFTLADVVDPISVFSVAGLVTAFVVVALVIHHLAFLYLALMVFVYGLPGSSFVLDGFEFVEVVVTSSALYLWDVVVYVVSSPLFQVQCIAVALYVLPYVDWYLDTMLTIDAWRHDVGVWISRVVEVGEDVWFPLEDTARRILELVDKTEVRFLIH
ncbi:hypothetical protein BDY19DRAFT_964148 [Irpex rosettiformis]|uniref:Uncharacterized protein n=1 Tax=Irpex rosettiformis TaxID=378272 RepID=A0ACB8TVB5_9APHY|nr:hypothetical protein BDY19DRAFT_964148 [Irpex rosettiformis]